MKWIFILILISGLISVSELAGTVADFSINFPYTVESYSTPSKNKLPIENLNANESYFQNDTKLPNRSHEEQDWKFNGSFPEDPQYCVDKKTLHCDPSYPYRTMNGSCNNLIHPTWGISNECYIRYQPAFYEGFETMLNSTNGDHLPPARDIILNIFKDVHRPSPNVSFMFTVYGQTVAHDFSRAENANILLPCCSSESANDSSCIAITIKSSDPFYSPFNVTCLNLHRTDSCAICNTGNREQLNAVTSALDASMVYGPDDKRAMERRAMDGTGKLILVPSKHGELLPRDKDTHSTFCRYKKPFTCFFSGDVQVNMHVFLTGITTYFVREHNRIATKLKKINPHWEEEKLFQEARRIKIATLQCITYKEYLPQLLSPYVTDLYNLTVTNAAHGSKYNPNVRLGVSNEFATAAFRLHSMVPKTVGSEGVRFKDLYIKPEIIQAGHLERLMHRMYKAPSEEYDHYYVNDVTDYMSQNQGVPYGTDLGSIDIMRARDHGLPPYAVMVRFCSGGKVKISTFDDLTPLLMSKDKAELLKENYASVEDIELYVGLQMEDHFPGSEVGPTAGCIIAKQFYTAKFGDRFFFDHEGEVLSFTADQRNSLKDCSLSRLLCDNSDTTRVQKNVMLLPSIRNPEVSCEEIPEIDFSLWKESPPA